MKKNIRFIALGLMVAFLSSFSYAADDTFHGVRATTRAYIGGEGETTGEVRMAKATEGGYIITSNLPSENSYVNESTVTSQNLCTSGCHFLRLIVGVADASTTVEFYDEADATCDANLITTVDSSAVASIAFGLKTVNGLCMKTIGHDTGNVTAVYK